KRRAFCIARSPLRLARFPPENTILTRHRRGPLVSNFCATHPARFLMTATLLGLARQSISLANEDNACSSKSLALVNRDYAPVSCSVPPRFPVISLLFPCYFLLFPVIFAPVCRFRLALL